MALRKKKKIQLPGSGTFDISELLLNFADYQKKQVFMDIVVER